MFDSHSGFDEFEIQIFEFEIVAGLTVGEFGQAHSSEPMDMDSSVYGFYT